MRLPCGEAVKRFMLHFFKRCHHHQHHWQWWEVRTHVFRKETVSNLLPILKMGMYHRAVLPHVDGPRQLGWVLHFATARSRTCAAMGQLRSGTVRLYLQLISLQHCNDRFLSYQCQSLTVSDSQIFLSDWIFDSVCEWLWQSQSQC